MRVGIDSYSYHRRYGEVRPTESAISGPIWALEPSPVLAHARELGVDVLMLETCYLPEPEDLSSEMFGDQPPTVGFSWGHPWPEGAIHGLEAGRRPESEPHLARWIDAAARFGHSVMRITVGSHVTRVDDTGPELIARLVGPVRRAADRAAGVGLSLAIENHGDLSAAELDELLRRVERPNVGVTLDNVNLLRRGDDMVEGTRLLAPHVLVVQMKDHQPIDDPNQPGGAVCTPLGAGVAPLEAVLEVLDESGFGGPVCVEIATVRGDVDELAWLDKSVAWLRDRL